MTEPEKPTRRHLNQDQKRALEVARVGEFFRQYGRRTQKNLDPNDRGYDREIERKLKQMAPDELDRLMREDEN